MADMEIDPQLRSHLIGLEAQVHVLQQATVSALMTLIKNCPPDLREQYVNSLATNMLMHNLPDDLMTPTERQYYVDLSTAIESCARDLAVFLRNEVAELAKRAAGHQKPPT